MSQYFDNDPTILSKDILINYEFAGHTFSLKSNNGIFSKNKLDDGTLVLLKAISKIPHNGYILDMGCGIGTVGITDAFINKDNSYLMIDINNRAIEAAKYNVKKMNLENRIEVIYSDIFSNINEKMFDYVLLNPPIRAGKETIYKMFKDSFTHLNEVGSLIIVIRKSHGANSASNYLKEIYSEVSLIYREKGYYVYQAKK